MVIGHEITHGFDDQGSQRDGQGNLVDWWNPASEDEYRKRTQCVVDQYANFTVDVGDGEILNVNGVNTLGENIADIGGYKEAYRAYASHETGVFEGPCSFGRTFSDSVQSARINGQQSRL